jgi:hypothetical protein
VQNLSQVQGGRNSAHRTVHSGESTRIRSTHGRDDGVQC